MKRWVQRTFWVGLFVALAIAVIAAIAGTMPIPFSETQWKSTTDRTRMAKGLIRDEALIGKTRSEVEAKLGKPAYSIESGWLPGTQSKLYGTDDAGRNLQYIVGEAGGFAFLGFKCLYVYLNTNDVVRFCEIGDRGI